MKFRCLLEPVIVEVDAENQYDAQLFAFARYVRDLSPSDIQCWEAKAGDEWEATA